MSPSFQHIVASTGFSPAQASKTLLLKEEISHLRRQGHSTETLIEQLKTRLHGVDWCDENEGCGVQAKRQKGNDEAVVTTPPTARPIAEDLLRSQPAMRYANEKRGRDEPAHLMQLKKLKLRASLGEG